MFFFILQHLSPLSNPSQQMDNEESRITPAWSRQYWSAEIRGIGVSGKNSHVLITGYEYLLMANIISYCYDLKYQYSNCYNN